MKILAIETSCDDTGIAVLEATSSKFQVLSNIVSSQTIHQNYGGVFPMMAKREHQRNLVPVLIEALKQAKLFKITNSKLQIPKLKTIKKVLEKESELYEKMIEFLETHQKPNIDAIAVTYGPGLEPCLWVGVNFARVLSYIWEIPLIPINHIEAHILVNFLPKVNKNPKLQIIPISSRILDRVGTNHKIEFPAIALVVSGGHTQLILVKGIGKYKIIGETRDDAAGECFDKCAKLLGLGYPGGPAIARIAEQWKLQNPSYPDYIEDPRQSRGKSQTKLPRPMIHSKDYDFSFSGLKTAVLYAIRDKKQDTITKEYVNEMCYEVQQAIIDVLIKKTLQAAKDYKAKSIILGGGVSANQELRKQFSKKVKKELYHDSDGRQNRGIRVIFPEKSLSTDNGLMIAVAGYFNRNKKASWKNLEAMANLRIGN